MRFKFIFILSQLCITSLFAQQPLLIKLTPRWANGKYTKRNRKINRFLVNYKANTLKYKRVECVLLTTRGKLLCFGGQQESRSPINTVSSLNLYHSWNTTDPAWSMIEVNNSPSAFFASTYLPISNNFFIDGGLQDTKKSQTMYYDTLNNIWVTPNIKGLPLIKR